VNGQRGSSRIAISRFLDRFLDHFLDRYLPTNSAKKTR
jgi:hypothetical protein